MRRRTATPKPINFSEFLKSTITDFGENATIGTLNDGIWQEYVRGETWNTVRIGSQFENPKFISIETLENEYKFYVENFENRINKVLGVY